MVGIEGTKIEEIKEVYSHEQPFQQSTEFLKNYPEWKLIPFHSTSVSAKLVKDLKDPTKAAITGERAAKIYGLNIIKEKINNNSENTTNAKIKDIHLKQIFSNLEKVLSSFFDFSFSP